ncbi:hypothetical protein VKT23_014850 [Stygiomarasmius scandens]|uniref:Helicase ATP-binding domain-containing protein n=1 Tax=Marasmiellus scandens TaxID=2682957 RepID=A0ABR1IZ83_9AGAR
MTHTNDWSSTEGLAIIKHIVSRCIPQWPDGLREWQLDAISTILNRQSLFAIAATGEGKSALYIIPVLVHLELSQHPDSYPSFRTPIPSRSHPVVLVITPTKALATNLIHELEQFNIPGFSYCHENITVYRKDKTNLESLICECKTWNIICVDPEHLAGPEWSQIIQDSTFRSNLILFTVDEAHLILSWGPKFRPYFETIGSFARGCIPEHTPVLSLTATSAVGASTTAICQSLGMLGSSYRLIRRSNERPNIQIAITPLNKVRGLSKYTCLLDYLRQGRKTVIHTNTIPEAYAIYEFLWDFIPESFNRLRRMRMYHSLCPDDYNRETFNLLDSDPYLQLVIATPGFTQGVNRKKLLDSISFGFPSTLNDFWQGCGCVGRDPNTICRGIALVSTKLLNSAEEIIKGLMPVSTHFVRLLKTIINKAHNDPNYILNTKSSKKNASPKKDSTTDTISVEKASFLTESVCYASNLNVYYGNPPVDSQVLDCFHANRMVYCGLCTERYGKVYEFLPPESSPALTWLPTPPPLKKTPNPRKSKNNLGKKEKESMRMWLLDF